MPYKLVGKAVYKKEGKKLTLIKKHPSHQKALAHFRALEINVSQKGLESTIDPTVLQAWVLEERE